VKIRNLALRVSAVLTVLTLAVSCTIVQPSFEDSSTVVTERCGDRDALPGEIVLNFWHALNNENQTAIEELTRRFNEEHKGSVCVNLTAQGNYDTARDNTDAAIKAKNNIPDLVTTYPDHVAMFALSGNVVDLKPFIDDPEIGFTQEEWEDIYEIYRNESHAYAGGYTYSLPLNKSTEVMFYNATFFETWLEQYGPQGLKDPSLIDVTDPSTWWTWEDIREVGLVVREITKTELNPETGKNYNEVTMTVGETPKTFKFPDGNPLLAYDSDENLFITLAHQSGGGYTSVDDQGNYSLDFMNEVTLGAVEKYEKLVEEYKVATIPALIDQSLRYASEPFLNEMIFMTVGSSAGSKHNDPQGKFKLGVAPIPQMDLENPKVIQQGTNITMLDTGKENSEARQRAAWLYIKHVTSTESSAYFASKTAYLPIRETSRLSQEYQEYLARTNRDGRPHAGAQAETVGSQQVFAYFFDEAFASSSKVRDDIGIALTEALSATTKSIRDTAQVVYDKYKNN
jgi:multiple sugar transport system substrate-binding protein